MAIDLKSLRKPEARAKIITITGEPGVGKTTLAALFPSPALIPVEDGTNKDMDVYVLPVPKDSDEIFDYIAQFGKQEHDFKTLIIDSVTQMNTMFAHEVVANDPSKPKSINQAMGGWGAGWAAVSDMHSKVRAWCGKLNASKGMHIVFLAHTIVETLDLPDHDPYMRYTLDLHKHSIKHYVHNVDCVAQVVQKTYTKGSDNKVAKAITTNEREVICLPNAGSVCKNRLGITEPMDFELGTNPFEQYI